MHLVYSHISYNSYKKHFNDQIKCFPKTYQNRLLSFRNWNDAQASMLGRLLLKWSLKKYYCYEIDFEKIVQNGGIKPFIPNVIFDFNISHSGTYIACILSDSAKVGIDIEIMRENLDLSSFYNQFTPLENLDILHAQNQITTFYNYWTQKEAIVKMLGKGMSIPFNSFEINNNSTVLNGKRIYTYQICLDENYSCHIASKSKSLNRISIEKVVFSYETSLVVSGRSTRQR